MQLVLLPGHPGSNDPAAWQGVQQSVSGWWGAGASRGEEQPPSPQEDLAETPSSTIVKAFRLPQHCLGGSEDLSRKPFSCARCMYFVVLVCSSFQCAAALTSVPMNPVCVQETPMSESGALFGQRWDSASQGLSRNTSDAEGNERFVDVSALPSAHHANPANPCNTHVRHRQQHRHKGHTRCPCSLP